MAKSTIKRIWDDASTCITAEYPDGIKVDYRVDTLSEAIQQDCKLHGLEQKLFDSIAGEASKGVTYAEIRDRVQKVYDNLVANVWKGKRGTSEGPSLVLLTEAVARLLANGDVELAKTHLARMSDEERASLGKSTEIMVAINTIKNERLLAAKKSEPTALDNLKKLFAAPAETPETPQA